MNAAVSIYQSIRGDLKYRPKDVEEPHTQFWRENIKAGYYDIE